MNFIITYYIIFINFIGFTIMGIDKWKARKNKFRISEKLLWTIAFIGGGMGSAMAMQFFRHKTKHKSFKYGLPLLALFEAVLFMLILM